MLYIDAIGFSKYNKKEKAEKLIAEIIKNPTTRYISNYKGDQIKVEYYKQYGKEFGLLVRGYLNEREELTVYSLIPYYKGSILLDTHEIDVTKADKNGAYTC